MKKVRVNFDSSLANADWPKRTDDRLETLFGQKAKRMAVAPSGGVMVAGKFYVAGETIRLSSSDDWVRYEGPRGGKGWQSAKTGRIVYQEESPGSGEHEGENELRGEQSVITETDQDTAALLLTQGIDPSNKRLIAQVNEFSPGRGAHREAVYVADEKAFSRGSFGPVRLHMRIPGERLEVPPEGKQLGHNDPFDALQHENGAALVGEHDPSVFTSIEEYEDGKWNEYDPSEWLEKHGLSSVGKLPSTAEYSEWIKGNAAEFFFTDDKARRQAVQYNRAKLKDKLFLAEEMREWQQQNRHKLTKSEYDSFVSSIKPKPTDYINVGDIRVIQNPTDDDYQYLSAQVREEYPHMPRGEATIRVTRDTKGNKWIWKAHQATHQMIEPSLSKIVGEELNQNNSVPRHSEIIKAAIRDGLEIPAKVQAEYPQYASYFS